MPRDSRKPLYLPHLQQPEVLSMGLSRIDPCQWIETDDSIGDFHRQKLALAEQDFSSVYADTGESEAAQAELAALLESHLLTAHGSCYLRDGADVRCEAGGFTVSNDLAPTLWRSSLLVAEDLLLMQPRGSVYHLVAAGLCSPSHWRLDEKIGRPMHEIHDPIPGVHNDLSARIDRFFASVRPEAPVQRFNWSLQWGDELFCPGHDTLTGGDLHYRAERQTLRRLPDSGAIVFTIRVYCHPAETLRSTPGALRTLRDAVQAAPPSLAAYKGFHRYEDAIDALCDTEQTII